MNRSKKAEFFDVSLTTLQNWKRQGCPVDSDVGEIALWKVRRDLRRAGAAAGDLPELMAEHARRLLDLGRRIASVNSLPPETGAIKAAMVYGLLLERALLFLPGRILKAGPGEAQESFYRAVIAVLDEAKGMGEDEEDPRGSARSPL